MIWLLAFFLLGFLAVLGFFSGAIKAGCSLAGLLLGALLAVPLAKPLQPVLKVIGLKHPVWVQVIAPLIIFLLIVIIAKIFGYTFHRKLDVHYKYKEPDQARYAWERLIQRLGFCLGLVNGAVYFFLLLLPIYIFGYLTFQLPEDEQNSSSVRWLNKVRAQIRSAGLDQPLAALDPAPDGYYEAADIIGNVSHNPLLVSRLSSYPVFLTLSEKPEFQALAADVEVNELIQSGKVMQVIKHPKVKAILTNAVLTAEIENLLKTDLKDLREYVETGRSKKYEGEKILGRWELEMNESLAYEKVLRPEVASSDLSRIRGTLTTNMKGLTLVATTDQQVILRLPILDTPSGAVIGNRVLVSGQWKNEGTGYQITLSNDKGQSATSSATVMGNLLSFSWNRLPLRLPLVFLRER